MPALAISFEPSFQREFRSRGEPNRQPIQFMRIAYITADPGVPVFGRKGCSIHAQQVLKAMLKRGVEVDLFATSCAGEVTEGLDKLHVHALPPAPKGDLASREKLCLAANEGLRSALESQGPFTMIYERYSLWSFAGMEYARTAGIPRLLEVNAPLIEEQAEHRGLIDHAAAERVAERVFAAATALIAVSEQVAEYLQRHPSTAGKVHVVPNGVNPEDFLAPASASRSKGSPFTVGFVGSMKPWHGVGNLIEAFALMKEEEGSRLLLVGDGPAREELATQAAALGLEGSVQFTGSVAPERVPGLLASMDVGVAPYPKLANFYFSPLKVYEYMAAGLPVVAGRVGQLEQLIESEVTGLLFAPGDTRGLAGALKRLSKDVELRQRLGQAAREKVLREHTWDGAVEKIFSVAGMLNHATS